MEPELVGVTIATPTGGSYRTTIPVSVARKIWKRDEKEHFAICFLKECERVLLMPFDEVIRKEDFPKELKEKAIDEWGVKALGDIGGKTRVEIMNLIKKLARGEIDSRGFSDELERALKRIQDNIRPYTGKIKGSLAFISDDLESLMLSASIAVEEEMEKEFKELSERISDIISRKNELEGLLSMLEEIKEIEEDVREFAESRIRIELEKINEGIERIKEIFCRS